MCEVRRDGGAEKIVTLLSQWQEAHLPEHSSTDIVVRPRFIRHIQNHVYRGFYCTAIPCDERFADLHARSVSRDEGRAIDVCGDIERSDCVGQPEDVWDSIFFDCCFRESRIRCEEDAVDQISKLIDRMTGQGNHLDVHPQDIVRFGVNDLVDMTRFCLQESSAESDRGEGATKEQGGLDHWGLDNCRLRPGCNDRSSRSLPDPGVCAKVISVSVCGQDADDRAAPLVVDRSFGLARYRVVEPAVNEKDVIVVDTHRAKVRPTLNHTHPIRKLDDCHDSGLLIQSNATALYSERPGRHSRPNDERVGSYVDHIIAVSQFDRPWVEALFARADAMIGVRASNGPLRDKILATLFYEPSTRTRLSFESAMLRLGGTVISTENAREFSSAIKGESVEDTVRIVSGYADGIVIRHHEQGAAARAAAASPVPIINAGDGPGEHPTQALLDLYTIKREIGRIDDLTVALVGDLRFGRAVRSLALLLCLATNVELLFVSPDAVPMGQDVRDTLTANQIRFREEPDLTTALSQANVVYQTRIQRERFSTVEEFQRSQGIYLITAPLLDHMKTDAILMHPLPRVDEIAQEVDFDPRAAYFRQAQNGVFIRMALLDLVFRQP